MLWYILQNFGQQVLTFGQHINHFIHKSAEKLPKKGFFGENLRVSDVFGHFIGLSGFRGL